MKKRNDRSITAALSLVVAIAFVILTSPEYVVCQCPFPDDGLDLPSILLVSKRLSPLQSVVLPPISSHHNPMCFENLFLLPLVFTQSRDPSMLLAPILRC